MQKILFYHGGPGLNSNAERNLLTPLYKSKHIDLHTWDEPSSLRGTLNIDNTNRFEDLLLDAEAFLLRHYEGKPLHLMGTSMGAQTIAYLQQRHADKIATLIFSAPCFNISQADQNTFALVANDYKENNDLENFEKLQSTVARLSDRFDMNKQQSWELTLANPHFLDYYWTNKSAQENYLANFAPQEYGLDIQGFFAVRKSMYNLTITPVQTKTIILYGANDKVAPMKDENPFLQDKFSNNKPYKMEHSSHYPHIEEAEKVLSIIMDNI